ncbi:MAG: hypothetical protein M0R80_03965 [Proteobacteria bacterium]|jgi:hypothetical protein|nr:hypothetical protein [Pseudomonadota bacterium]
MEEDVIIGEDDWAPIPPIRSYKMVMVPPEKYATLKSITEEIVNRSWFSADWPMECKICGEVYPNHYEFCLVLKAKKVLEEV